MVILWAIALNFEVLLVVTLYQIGGPNDVRMHKNYPNKNHHQSKQFALIYLIIIFLNKTS